MNSKIKPNHLLKGISWNLLSSVVRALIQIIQLILLANYLKPSELGAVAIIQLVLNFAHLFSDAGISNAVIHHQVLTKKQMVLLYLLNIGSSLFLTAIIILFSTQIADFYDAPNLVELIQLAAVTLICVAIGRQSQSVLQKELQFNIIAKVELLGALIGFVCVFIALTMDYGVSSLIFGMIVASTTKSLLFIYFKAPSLYVNDFFTLKADEYRHLIKFGLFQTGDGVINYFNSNFDSLIIGKFLGMEALGVYNLFKQLLVRPIGLINQVLTRVTFPIMASVQESKSLSSFYCNTLQLLLLIIFPLYITLIIFGESLIVIAFGEDWLSEILVFQIMAFWCLLRAIVNPVGSLLLAKGEVKRSFIWNTCLSLFIPVCLYFSLPFDLIGVVCV